MADTPPEHQERHDLVKEVTKESIFISYNGRDLYLKKNDLPPIVWEKVTENLVNTLFLFADLTKYYQE